MPLKALVALACLLLIALPTNPALAAPFQDILSGLDPAFTRNFVVAVIFLSGFLSFAIWAVVKRDQALDQAATAEAAANFSTLLLDQNPSAFLVLFADGTCFCSDRLRDWLALSHAVNTIEDLGAGIDGETGSETGGETDGETDGGGLSRSELGQLTDALEALDQTGEPFTTGLRMEGTGQALIASGNRVNSAEAGGTFDLVWFSDVSQNADDLDQLRASLGTLESRLGQLTDALDAAPFPVWIRDADLNLQYVNAAYTKAVDEESAATTIEKQIELCAQVLAEGARDSARKARETATIQGARQYTVIDGERRALDVIDVPAAHGGGIIGFALDVTDAERTRSELHMHLGSHTDTLNRLSAPVAIFSADTTLTFYNNAFVRLWGLSEDWMQEGPSHSELLENLRETQKLPEQADFPAWKKQHLNYYTELLDPVEDMWHLPDGKTLRVVTQPHPLGGLLVIFEDVTDRLALERSYNTLIAVQRETLDNLHESVAVIGSDLQIKLYNPNFAQAFALQESYLDSDPHFGDMLDKCQEVLCESDEAWEAIKSDIIGNSLDRDQSTGTWTFTTGSVYQYAFVALPDGASLLTMVDVTDSAHIEQALRERSEALVAADKLKSEFIANMSYELRTPLNSILGFSEMLESEYFGTLNERQLEYVDGVVISSRLLRDLIDDILDLAVIEAGDLSLDITSFDVAEAAQSVATLAQDRGRLKNIEIRTNCQKGVGEMSGDKRRIKHAIYNVLLNAISFTPDGGRINLAVKNGGDTGNDDGITITITDTGIGIAAEDRDKVFERFHRGSNRSESGSGAGLGLALVRSFVDLHGGDVTIDSEPGKGTTVAFHLPRHAQITEAVLDATPETGKSGIPMLDPTLDEASDTEGATQPVAVGH